jgi:protein-S-isoprenylcysteine O-methyltransferase Ste14
VALVDAVLLVAWGGLAVDLLLRARGMSHATARVRAWAPPIPLRIGLVVALLGGAWWLERLAGGTWPVPAALRACGALVAVAGLALHARARRALGRHWSATVLLRDGHVLVTDGPYGRVRHPLYGALLVMAAGTLLGHPSVATLSLAVGLALGVGIKVRREDAALRGAFGDAWQRWAADVPALLPRRRARRTA